MVAGPRSDGSCVGSISVSVVVGRGERCGVVAAEVGDVAWEVVEKVGDCIGCEVSPAGDIRLRVTYDCFRKSSNTLAKLSVPCPSVTR